MLLKSIWSTKLFNVSHFCDSFVKEYASSAMWREVGFMFGRCTSKRVTMALVCLLLVLFCRIDSCLKAVVQFEDVYVSAFVFICRTND